MTTSLLPSLGAFVVVIMLIPAALWLVRRSQSLRPGGSGPMSVVAGLPLGPRERIAVVRVADRHLVVGVTAQTVTLLATLDGWPAGEAQAASAAPFAALLDRVNKNARKDS